MSPPFWPTFETPSSLDTLHRLLTTRNDVRKETALETVRVELGSGERLGKENSECRMQAEEEKNHEPGTGPGRKETERKRKGGSKEMCLPNH